MTTMNTTAWSRLLRAGTLTAIVDGLFACVQTVIYGSTVTRLWQGVASTLLGPAALQGGTRTALIGVLMHIGVAFGWSAVFVFGVMRLPLVRRSLASRWGPLTVGAIYGPFIWMVMSLAVIPLLVHRPPTIALRWWLQLVGHMFFVGLPIAFGASRGLARSKA